MNWSEVVGRVERGEATPEEIEAIRTATAAFAIAMREVIPLIQDAMDGIASACLALPGVGSDTP